MKITRIFTAENGNSRFEDVNLSLEPGGDYGDFSKPCQSLSFTFRETSPFHDFDCHPSPHRQLVVLLDAAIEIFASGEKREFRTGDVLLLEDTFGRGHCVRAINGRKRLALFIELPCDWDKDFISDALKSFIEAWPSYEARS